MTKKNELDELREQLAARNAEIDEKNLELRKLYKLVNRSKATITDLEIKLIDLEVRIETQSEIINAQRMSAASEEGKLP